MWSVPLESSADPFQWAPLANKAPSCFLKLISTLFCSSLTHWKIPSSNSLFSLTLHICLLYHIYKCINMLRLFEHPPPRRQQLPHSFVPLSLVASGLPGLHQPWGAMGSPWIVQWRALAQLPWPISNTGFCCLLSSQDTSFLLIIGYLTKIPFSKCFTSCFLPSVQVL